MHKVSIPDDIVARARLQRGGREHLFEILDMSRVAHIIVDLQVGFVAKGAAVEVPATRDMIGEGSSRHMRSSCASVTAVPLGATASAMPARSRAITSMYPSTTISRFAVRLAGEARSML